MHKHAMEPVTAGGGSSNALVPSSGPFQCEYCDHEPFTSRIALGLHRRHAHNVSREEHQRALATRQPIIAMTMRTRTLRATERITDFRIIQPPKHQLKFCPGCSFPMRDLLDGAHAEGSPFKLQVCPCCLFPVEAMHAAERIINEKHEAPSVAC